VPFFFQDHLIQKKPSPGDRLFWLDVPGKISHWLIKIQSDIHSLQIRRFGLDFFFLPGCQNFLEQPVPSLSEEPLMEFPIPGPAFFRGQGIMDLFNPALMKNFILHQSRKNLLTLGVPAGSYGLLIKSLSFLFPFPGPGQHVY